MDAHTAQSVKTPWHLWVVGVISLLWNIMGALDFTMTQTKNPAWMEKFTPTQLEYFYSIPGWAVTTWGIATWGSMVAAIVLLLRKRLAVALYTVALIGMVATTVYSFVLSDGMKVMGGTAPLIFNAIIFIISVLEIIYARAMRARGVLT